MTLPNDHSDASVDETINDDDDQKSINWRDAFNVPNIICIARIVGIPFSLWLAWKDLPSWYILFIFILLASDLIDGRIARSWNQRTTLGARLDSLADILLYTSFIPALWWLEKQYALAAMPVAIGVAVSYAILFIACMVRFRKVPSFHTRGAKLAWGLMLLGVVTAALGYAVWPLMVALAWVIVVNIEALLITFTITHWRADVLSYFHARRARQRDAIRDHP